MKKISQRAARAMQKHLQRLLNMSNAGRPEFADSCADVVQELWLLPNEIGGLLDQSTIEGDE